MTEQTEAAEVEALASLVYDWLYPEATKRESDDFARQILASDYIAARIAAAEARGAERALREAADHFEKYDEVYIGETDIGSSMIPMSPAERLRTRADAIAAATRGVEGGAS